MQRVQTNGETRNKSSSITRPANANAYAGGDAVSDATGDAMFEFSNPVGYGGNNGVIRHAKLMTDNPALMGFAAKLYMFGIEPTNVADNAAWEPSDTETDDLIGVLEFPQADFYPLANNAVCMVQPNLTFRLARAGDGSLAKIYGQLVMDSAYTPASGEVLTIDLMIERL